MYSLSKLCFLSVQTLTNKDSFLIKSKNNVSILNFCSNQGSFSDTYIKYYIVRLTIFRNMQIDMVTLRKGKFYKKNDSKV
ncbi:hypothetical protein BpHYR1_032377 [Brachionus plicatilis]|uniref:Uncharacterized protein n=1 Tax=Brachionus plicatilis TaxID=10195 RepID=A0A3M7SGN6_BRAPC|nr:hypothetical protein BpHYR1_032377 [Brachionus plicatilis]